MCTGVELALIASAALTVAGTTAQGVAASKRAKAQASARNEALSGFLDKNQVLEEESRSILQRRLDAEDAAPAEVLASLTARRNDESASAIDRATVAAPIPLGGNVPQVVTDRASAAQESTDVEAKRRAGALASVRSFGDLFFDKALATGDAARGINTLGGFSRANARLLPFQQDLAAQSKAGVGQGLEFGGGIVSALGTLGAAGAGAGVFSGSGGGTSPKTSKSTTSLGFN